MGLPAAALTRVEAAPPPTVTSVSPNSGPTAGGTIVTITGTHLIGATAVTFGGIPATGVTVNSAIKITTITPAHLAGVVDVAVTTPDGSDTGTGLYTYVAPLSLAATASATTQVGQSYSQTNVASGGTTPYTYSVSAGALPAGTTLNVANGTVAGTPTVAGPFSYTIMVTDSSLPTPQTATQTVSGTIGTTNTTTSIASSVNPSSVGQSVTFVATIATGGGTATGTVTFNDGNTMLGTGTVTGNGATFTTASLTSGIHSVTAVYGGDGNYTASTSPALKQVVAIPADSLKLRALQLAATPLAAQISGQAIAGAINNAIENGFSIDQRALTCNVNSIIFNCGEERDYRVATTDGITEFVAAPDQPVSRIDNGFSALAYSRDVAKAIRRATALQREWLSWIDVRGVNVDQRSIDNDLNGNQVNALAGITHKFTQELLVGVFGGYEYISYASDALNGRLKGNGWTVGSYLGWRFTPTMRLDMGVAGSSVNFNGRAGTASGSFPGSRWFATGGLTGMYPWQVLTFEPSARIYALWEHEDEYIDTLGTIQNSRNFFTGRASGGIKVSYPFVALGKTAVAPYVGMYGDYYFTSDDASTAVLAALPFLQGWSVRFTSGLSLSFHGDAQLGVGGEVGGIGTNTTILTLRAHVSVPF